MVHSTQIKAHGEKLSCLEEVGAGIRPALRSPTLRQFGGRPNPEYNAERFFKKPEARQGSHKAGIQGWTRDELNRRSNHRKETKVKPISTGAIRIPAESEQPWCIAHRSRHMERCSHASKRLVLESDPRSDRQCFGNPVVAQIRNITPNDFLRNQRPGKEAIRPESRDGHEMN